MDNPAYEARIRELQTALRAEINMRRQADFRLAVAEWGLAGLMSRNLRVNVALSGLEILQIGFDQDRFAKVVGKNAGYQFLEAAELHFRNHAELSEYKARETHSMEFADPHESTVPGFIYAWPRPWACTINGTPSSPTYDYRTLADEIERLRAVVGMINMLACYASEEDTDSRAAVLLQIGKLARGEVSPEVPESLAETFPKHEDKP